MAQDTHPIPTECETKYPIVKETMEKRLSYKQKELYDNLIDAGCLTPIAFHKAITHKQ